MIPWRLPPRDRKGHRMPPKTVDSTLTDIEGAMEGQTRVHVGKKELAGVQSVSFIIQHLSPASLCSDVASRPSGLAYCNGECYVKNLNLLQPRLPFEKNERTNETGQVLIALLALRYDA